MTEHDPKEGETEMYFPDDPGHGPAEEGLSARFSATAEDLPPGLATCEDEPGPSADQSQEREVAIAIGRALDSIAELTKFLPLPDHVGDRLRADLFCAWRRVQQHAGVCEDDGGVDHG